MTMDVQTKKEKNESCILINTSKNYLTTACIAIMAFICTIQFLWGKQWSFMLYSISIMLLCCILICVRHIFYRTRINKIFKANKSIYKYKIEGKIYELESPTKEEYCNLKFKEYYFTILCNQFSINSNGIAYVIRNKSTLSEPDAKVYIDNSYSEEISIYYNQITDIETGKVFCVEELKQFLKQE